MTADIHTFVLQSLPPPPARVLEVGAGQGELAAVLRERGYDVVAIDPGSHSPGVEAVALHAYDAPPASFDAAVAVLSLHHVEPLDESSRHLASLVRSGGRLVVDEFDIARFDLTAASWWLGQGPADDHASDLEPEAIVGDVRSHLHPLAQIVAALEPWFELSDIERGPYLHRWKLPPDSLGAEERAIASGELPATGARLVGRRS